MPTHVPNEERFNIAVNAVQNLPKDGPFNPTNEQKLKFYSAFKQATEGPCDKPKPSFWDVVAKAKWEAWKGLGNMSKNDAMQAYVDNLLTIARTLPKMPELDEFMRKMGEDEIPAAETEQEAASTESPAEASIAAATHSEAEDDGQRGGALPGRQTKANSGSTPTAKRKHPPADVANGVNGTDPRALHPTHALPTPGAGGRDASPSMSLSPSGSVGVGIGSLLSPLPTRASGLVQGAGGNVRETAILRRSSLSGRIALLADRSGASESDGDTDAGRESATSSSRANGGHASPRSTATDDDSDVFCDPLDLPPASHGQFVTSTEHGSGSVGDDGRGVFSSSTSNGGHGIAAASHPSGGHVVTKAAAASASVDEVRKIMLRTQQDLERTVSRVAALEAAVEELRKRPAAGASPTAKQTLPADEFEWPLAGVSRNSKIFLVLWPVVVHLIFRLLSRRSRRPQKP